MILVRPFFAFLLFAFIMGCAHSVRRELRVEDSLAPPSEKQIRENPTARSVVWMLSFREGLDAQAKNERERACTAFRRLINENDFPLRELALLRAHQTCLSTTDLAAPWRTGPTAAWMSWYAEDLLLAKEGDWEKSTPAEQIALLWEKAAIEKDERRRETLLVDATSLAEKNGEATLAESARQRLWKNSPRLKPSPKKADWPAIALDLRRWRDFGRSVQLERKRLDDRSLSDDERFTILKSIRQTWKTAQNKSEMLAASADLLNFAKASFRKHRRDPAAARRLLETRTLYARTMWTESRRDLALRSLNDARRELSGLVSLEEVSFIIARIHEESGDLAKAEEFLAQSLREKPITSGLREKARWAHAWVLYKLSRAADAHDEFRAISVDAKEPGDRVRGGYWAARTAPDVDRAAAMKDVRTADPLGFYGLMAARDLKEPLAPLIAAATGDLRLTTSAEFATRPALIVEWMIALGLTDGTARVIDSLQDDLKRNPRASTDAWLRLSSAYARAGQYLPLFSLMSTLTPELRDRLLREQPDLLFPKPWLADANRAANDAEIPVELLYAITRQESAFNPRARSPAEAYGLTQLLPAIASAHARRHGIAYRGAEDLFDPTTSLRLGAWELRGTMDRWKGRWIPAIASYNANADAVRGWLKHRHRPDPVEFIEEIPYEETRTYVKLVMRNQVFYKRLLANEPFLFPENCLTMDDVSP